MRNVYDILKERGFTEQATHEEEIRELLGKESVTFYIGFDPTADSLHVGHFVTIMAMSHMQKAGHRPIALIGGGTAMVGDPTGKTDMRKMMTEETIAHNAECFKKQLSRFIEFGEDKAIMVNNADWLLNLNYVSFLREIGIHFSVNRMLTYESYKTRMEKGLSFLEFNYTLMQSYDFLELYRRYNCKLQLGGNDQWSNILGGVELIRRIGHDDAYGMTFSLLTTSEGKKMGKTEKGAIWLDPEKTSPYDFYQYWRNVADADVKKCLSLLTFLPMDEVNRLSALEGAKINEAKEVLAYEVTKIVHGEEEAKKAQTAAKALFGGGAQGGSIPTTEISKDEFKDGMDLISLLQKTGLAPSRSEGRRLIQQGGIKVQDQKVTDLDYLVTEKDFSENALMIQKGKKVFHRVQLI
ncbi:MAG: tyrosyl-tRNA synthetase [Epulopiscium sp.]|jgi:tyrosyl-tRNA synthetase|uniref:tyrosine--tRNA ligase n=1 Tax=Defluviitalea raffinosedens TaxID=1450156 RepID=UPI00176E48A1|nr:tyrosine--tRNA ligase [Defluviitalea raffinosedens]MBM7685336.1 tyrosyl-tRNA synthetase [Defluviitalea raffinosedens]MBZ4669526.1 tyrosine--tRNA ligase [Defluviitaleaceae bacterium]MDK2788558.1 tyrosyl-tRNA synthetase [Candidatus Epulonipiscium sp.]HHW67225.1 tyrosine--tRNA ligase [Candidatus Epulonipiscium sp.]